MRALRVVVIGVVDLEPGHPPLGHLLDQLVGHGAAPLPHPRVREHADAAGVGDQRERVDGVERVLGHVRGAVVGDVPIERLLLGGDDAGLDHRLGDVGPGDQVVAGDRAHALERHVVARSPGASRP